MTLSEYNQFVRNTAHYPVIEHSVVYPTIALAGEVGEFANEVKKVFRDDGGEINRDRNTKLIDELGDVAWYVFACAHELGVTMEYVLERNMVKLLERRRARELAQSNGWPA